MVQLNLGKVALSANLVLRDETLKQHFDLPPQELGRQLAHAVDDWVTRHQTGYYPALSFFEDMDDFDANLLVQIERAVWTTCKLAREQILQVLRPVCSRVEIQSLMCPVTGMPRVRPGQAGARDELAAWYAPNRVRVGLVLSSIDKQPASEGYAVGVSRKAHFWLNEAFDGVELAFDRS